MASGIDDLWADWVTSRRSLAAAIKSAKASLLPLEPGDDPWSLIGRRDTISPSASDAG
jgi:hypothetical protein